MSGRAWLAEAVADVVRRAGGATHRAGGDTLTAVVTARTSEEFDVVLELTESAVTLRVWGLERCHDLPPAASPADWAAAALRALDDWLALLAGDAHLVVFDRAGAARCWAITGGDDARPADPRWHPEPPPSALVRWMRRWRRQVHANRFLDAAAVDAVRADARAAAMGSIQPTTDRRRTPLAVA